VGQPLFKNRLRKQKSLTVAGVLQQEAPHNSLGYRPPAPEPELPIQEMPMQKNAAQTNIQTRPANSGRS